MEIKVITEYSEQYFSDWKEFLSKQSVQTVFQSPEMYSHFENSDNFKPVLVIARSNNKICGILLGAIIKEYSGMLGILTSRTVIYGGPVIENEFPNKSVLLDTMLKELIQLVKNKSVFIQFRNFFEWDKLINVFENNGFNHLDRLNYLVDTTSIELVKKRMSKSKLRQIKNGIAAGAEIIEPENLDQVKDFFQILYKLYRNKVKKPLPKWSFFESFYNLSKNKELGILRLIRFEDKIIGGIVAPITPDKVVYEWYICGLDQEHKKLYPSVLATWAAIDYAVKNNITSFDFMGVGKPGKDYGVREFKSKFGGEMTNYGRFGRINNHFVYLLTEIGFNILAMLKKI